MPERRPSMKRPGITATGRQWQTIEALRADGWFVLEADPKQWSDDDAERITEALEERDRDESTHGHRCEITSDLLASAESTWCVECSCGLVVRVERFDHAAGILTQHMKESRG